jgi:LysR family transcriptional regulator for metE and metH
MHLDVRHLRLVAAITDCGGLTKAAARLNLTQSALSHQLADIERRLGTPLFHRVKRRLVLTDAGERLLTVATRVLAELDALEAEITAGALAGPAGVRRLTTECYTAYHWLPAVLGRFRDAWPRVEVRIVAEATGRAMAALSEGQIDLAIVQHAPENRRYAATPLFDDEVVVIVHPEHRWASQPYVSVRDFRHEHLIVYSTPHSESHLLRDYLRPARVTPKQLTRVQLTEAIIELVKADLGVAVLAQWAVAPHIAAGTLAAVPLTRRGWQRRWYAVTRTAHEPAAFLREFLQLLSLDRFSETPASGRPRLTVAR